MARSSDPQHLDALVQEALNKVGSVPTESYDKFRASLPSLSHAGAEEEGGDGVTATAGRHQAQSLFTSVDNTPEEHMRREYEAAYDPQLDGEFERNGAEPVVDDLEAEDLDEDGIAVQQLSRASSGFILDGPGNLQFNNLFPEEEEDGGSDGEEGGGSAYVPSAVAAAEGRETLLACRAAAAQRAAATAAARPAPPIERLASLRIGDPAAEVIGPVRGSPGTPQEMLGAQFSLPQGVEDEAPPPDRSGILSDADAFIQSSLPLRQDGGSDCGGSAGAEVRGSADGMRESEEEAADIVARFSAPGEDGEDSVTPFRLDSTFDYDNCPLTPKPWWACPPGRGGGPPGPPAV